MDWEKRIAADPKVLGGKPAVKGTRISVALVCELLDAGSSVADILDSYPFLAPEDIAACQSYAEKHGTELRSRVRIDDNGIHLPGKSLPWDKVLPLQSK
ncbi:MAG: DUF433 domain-containing protein [Chloroflexota bacterium]|nr:DUF433 domain-containing protein [Chloroflexota bacterium]MDE2685262.1 DUF433 domain-containing protein [Chloroflexota bacterium]